MTQDRRIFVPGNPEASGLVIAVLVPIAMPDEALVVELYRTGTLRSAWGELDMGEALYLAGGMRRDDEAEIPRTVAETIERRYPEHLGWPELASPPGVP